MLPVMKILEISEGKNPLPLTVLPLPSLLDLFYFHLSWKSGPRDVSFFTKFLTLFTFLHYFHSFSSLLSCHVVWLPCRMAKVVTPAVVTAARTLSTKLPRRRVSSLPLDAFLGRRRKAGSAFLARTPPAKVRH